MKRTIGSDRLGSGKKMKVDLRGYERSTHNLGYIWRSTMAAGTLVPFMTEVGLPGDSFEINLDCDLKTHPTVGPLFGTYKVQLDVFVAPIRLYQGKLHNNALNIGMKMNQILLPQMELRAAVLNDQYDADNQQINPSSIFSYLNIRGLGGGTGNDNITVVRKFNAVPYISYWDIYKNYYANKQEGYGAVIHTPPPVTGGAINSIILNINGTAHPTLVPGTTQNIAINGMRATDTCTIIMPTTVPPTLDTIMINVQNGQQQKITDMFTFGEFNVTTKTVVGNGNKIGSVWNVKGYNYISANQPLDTEPKVRTFDLENIDRMRNLILSATPNSTVFEINESSLEPYSLPLKFSGTPIRYSKMSSQEGLAIKTYQSDMFNNWLDTETIDGVSGVNAITAIDTSEGSFTVDTLQLATKVRDMLNRIAISGGTYDDWLQTVWDHDTYTKASTPMYMGGLSKELVFQEVVSNAEAGDGEQPLGTLAGRGVLSGKHKGGKINIKIDEPSYIMGLISLTPRVDYSQGNKWDVNLKTMDDFHKPGLDEIGFQDLITDQMAWFDTKIVGSNITFKSAGKQPAWMNYMTNVNQTRGNFASKDNEMFMTLNRRYEKLKGIDGIGDLTTYIDPVKFNHIFAQTSRDAQNFWAQIAVDITARRKMSAKIMPNL